MNDTQREVLVLDFVRRFKDKGSWCGETHIQKSMYFLQEFMNVPLDLNYIFYKHGPYSFDLNDLLTALRGNGLVEIRSHAPYGPHLHATASAAGYLALYSVTIARYQAAMDFVAEKLAQKNVAELERLSTALYVRLQSPNGAHAELAEEMNKLKPHVGIHDALEALQQVEAFKAELVTPLVA